MYLGTQFAARTDSDYETFKQLGVNNINGFPETPHQIGQLKTLFNIEKKLSRMI